MGWLKFRISNMKKIQFELLPIVASCVLLGAILVFTPAKKSLNTERMKNCAYLLHRLMSKS